MKSCGLLLRDSWFCWWFVFQFKNISGDCGIAGLFVLSQGNLDCQGPDEFWGTVAKPTIIVRNDLGAILDIPDHFIWAWWCSFLTVLMVLWAGSFPCDCPKYQSDQRHPKGYIMEPRELVETIPPFLGSGQSVPPLGAATDKSRCVLQNSQRPPAAVVHVCCPGFPLSISTLLAWGRSWTELKCAALPRSCPCWKWCPSLWGDTYMTKVRCPVGDTPSPCHVLWQTRSPLLGGHLAQRSQLLICSGEPGEFGTWNMTVFSAKKERFPGAFLAFAVEIKAVCDYLIWEPIQGLATASKEVLTAWNVIPVAELLSSKWTEFHAIFCIFWARPSNQDQDIELDSIHLGRTVQGVKDRFVGLPVPKIAETHLRFPSRNQRTDRTLSLEGSQTSLHRGKHIIISISLVWRAEDKNTVTKYQFRNNWVEFYFLSYTAGPDALSKLFF